MAGLHREQGKLTEAETLHREALNGARRTLPKGHWRIGTFLCSYGQTLTKLDRYEESETALLEAHQILAAAKGQSHKGTTKAVNTLIDFEAVIREGIERAGFTETMVYLQVTRGVQPRAHVWSDDLTPTVVMTFRPKPAIDAAVRATGISVVTVDDTRRTDCEIKATALLTNVLALHRARREGYDDVVFVGNTGWVRESSSANVFAVRGGTLLTPARDASILHGITRGVVFDCAQRTNITVEERPLTVPDLESADEVFLSSTSVDILPVTRVNNHPIAAARPGPITLRLHQTFLDVLHTE